MTREELEMRTLVRESDVIDRTDGSELAKAFNHLWDKYVEQEPKTGHWDKKDLGHVECSAVCSECGEWTYWSERSNFCPNCGARMVEPQESEK